MAERIPVIIAAHNEEQYIGRTLSRLDPALVEPIVVVNGSTDNTAAVVESFGITPIMREEPGKLPAVQEALHTLGSRALGPVLFTDADAYPLRPSKWPLAMVQPLMSTERPAVVAGMSKFCDTDPISAITRYFISTLQTIHARREGSVHHFYGFNMGVRLADPELLEEVLDLPHIWPGEDRYLAHVVSKKGEMFQLTSRDSLVNASGRCCYPLIRILLEGRAAVRQSHRQAYIDRAAPGVTHYFYDRELEPISTPLAITA